MKKVLFSLVCFILLSTQLNAQRDCVLCTDDYQIAGQYSSKLGYHNNPSANYSIAGGQYCISSGVSSIALGQYCVTAGTSSIAFGDRDTAANIDRYFSMALGSQCNASGRWSFAAGTLSKAKGDNAIALGYNAIAEYQENVAIGKCVTSSTYLETSAFTFGTYLTNRGAFSILIGKGIQNDLRMENDIDNCMLIGFNSKAPTLYIGPSSSTELDRYKTGRIGIGNITAPEAKLHILADPGDTANLYIQTSLTGVTKPAKIYLANKNYSIEATVGNDLVFFTGHNVVFKNGRFGIGNITAPSSKVHIKADQNEAADLFIEPYTWVSNSTAELYLGTKDHSIKATANEGLVFHSNKDFLFQNGKVGIGTSIPQTFQNFNLFVKGGIVTEEVKILLEPDWWPDYVFNKSYELKGLDELRNYIEENGHLPDMPKKQEVEENGIDLGKMNALLLKKMEELTLYILEQEERINTLDEKLKNSE